MASDRQPVRFGIFEVDLQTGELRRKGVSVKLQEQPFQVLVALLEKPGEVVTKEKLQERIWKHDTFVDFDRSLATAISKIRQALGDSATQPRFIETVPKRGYRFLAAGPPPTGRVDASRPGSVRLAFFGAAIFIVVVAAGSFLVGRIRTEKAQPAPNFNAVPLTSFRGFEVHPAISPGGDRVAYVRSPADQVDSFNSDIYVQTIGSGTDPIRLTRDAQTELSPTWSPDGNYVAFLRGYPGQAEIVRIPSIGGPEQKIGEAFFPPALMVGLALSQTYLDWSPDGRFLVVALGETENESSPHQLEVATGNVTPLPRAGNAPIGSPAYSPDGRSLAYHTPSEALKRDIWVQDLSDSGEPVGERRQLTWHESWMAGLDWTPDGRKIVFVSTFEQVKRFWRVSIDVGEPEIVDLSAQSALQLSIDPQSRRLVFARASEGSTDIWSLPGPLAQDRGTVPPERLVASTLVDRSAHFSPDGKRIVFVSNRTAGNQELWTSYADGSDLKQITSFNGKNVGSPRWSPDGQFIAFDGNKEGPFDTYVVRPEGGEVRRVTASASVDIRPSWSHDGEWIYHFSGRSGKDALWKTPAAGGEAVQVTQSGGNESFELADGALYYFKKVGDGEIWRLFAGAANAERILTGIESTQWTVIEDGICFVSDVDQTPQSLSFYDFATHTTTRFAELPEGTRVDGSPGLSVSPDGLQVVIGLSEDGFGDIMLVEDFH